MITYKCCLEVSLEDVYQAFALGFSDYVVPMTLTKEAFITRFFGPEGNTLANSFIAYDEEAPVGLLLGGIRLFDGLKTMRCGTLCVGPEYRGKQISQRLMESHMEAAKANGCKQLFLEVIKGNDRAINFYKRLGYYPVYDLKYYSAQVKNLKLKPELEYVPTVIQFEALSDIRRKLKDLHINWQSDVEYYAMSSGDVFLEIKDKETSIGYIAMSPTGKINFLWIAPQYRHNGLATHLIVSAAQQLGVEKVTTCLPSNALYEGYLRKVGFTKETIEQFEMYLPL